MLNDLTLPCRTLLVGITFALASGCASVDLFGDGPPDAKQVAVQSFGMMERFAGLQFVSGQTFLEIASADQGRTLVVKYGHKSGPREFELRKTGKPGQLQVVGDAKAKATLDTLGVLTVESFDKMVFRVNAQQLPSVDFYRHVYGAIWDSHEFSRRQDFVALTPDNERAEKARQLADDQQRRQAARAEREASLATARAWAGALSGVAAGMTPPAPPPPVRIGAAPTSAAAPASVSAPRAPAATAPSDRQPLTGTSRPPEESKASAASSRSVPITSGDPKADAQRRAQAEAAEKRREAEAEAEAQRQRLAKGRADEQREKNASAAWARTGQQHGVLGGGSAQAASSDSPGKAGAWCTKSKNGEFRCMGPAYKSTGTWAQLEAALRMAGCPAGQGYSPVVGSGQYFDCGRPLKRNENVMPTYDPYAGTN